MYQLKKNVVAATLTKEGHDDLILDFKTSIEAERKKIIRFLNHTSQFVNGLYNGAKIYVAEQASINAKLPIQRYTKEGYIQKRQQLKNTSLKLEKAEEALTKALYTYYGALSLNMLSCYVAEDYHRRLATELEKEKISELKKDLEEEKKKKLNEKMLLLARQTEIYESYTKSKKKARGPKPRFLCNIEDEEEEIMDMDKDIPIQAALPDPTKLVNTQYQGDVDEALAQIAILEKEGKNDKP